jgi:hypothetical protein
VRQRAGKRLIKSQRGASVLLDCDGTLEVVGFGTGDQANVHQRRKLLLGLGGLTEHQIEFTEVLVGTAVAAIEK